MDHSNSLLISTTKKTGKKLPSPTYWIERTPDSSPPADVLLLLLGYENEEAGTTLAVTGFYSSKLEQFLDVHHTALEQDNTVTHYHVIVMPNGSPFYL